MGHSFVIATRCAKTPYTTVSFLVEQRVYLGNPASHVYKAMIWRQKFNSQFFDNVSYTFLSLLTCPALVSCSYYMKCQPYDTRFVYRHYLLTLHVYNLKEEVKCIHRLLDILVTQLKSCEYMTKFNFLIIFVKNRLF